MKVLFLIALAAAATGPFFVDEAARGHGIGRALLDDVVARARAAGAAQLSLESGPAREAAHALYRSSGFVEAGRTWLLRRDR